MKTKIKLKDLTKQQYKQWHNENCKGQCEREYCEFKYVNCKEDSDACWVMHKNLFSDKFLNQKIKIEVKKPKLTKDEKTILKNLDKKWKYIARDDDGSLFVHIAKPEKHYRYWNSGFGLYTQLDVFTDLFKFITYDDSEPYSIKELLKG